MLTAVLSLTSAFAYTVHDYLMMRVVRATPVLTALFWVQLVGVALLVPLWLVFEDLPSGPDEWRAAGMAALTGPIEILALACLLKGLAVGKLSVVGPLAALGGGFGAAFAIAFGEPVEGLAVIGLPLAVVGAVLASAEHSPDDERRVKATAGAGWGLLCALIWGIEPVLIGEATLLPSITVVAIGRLTSLLVLAPFTALLGGFALQRVFARRVAVAGAVDAGGFLVWVAATAIGPVATASVLVAQTGTMSALLGTAVLHERPTRVQLAGIAATLVAVTLLALSGSG
jgi:drug/metabolite transporter (DMT)-like permease